MSKYTSTREGFQLSMELSLTGPPEGFAQYAAEVNTPNFYHIMNNQRYEYDEYVKGCAEWRAKSGDYKPVIHEFLRDGDSLAARMTGTMKIDGVENQFESFMFAKVDKESGRMEWLKERSIWGPVGKAPEHGVN
ncbi:hypothetical protein JX265_006597 [Neoarthrinium moseri]|uniref:Uncharacterized protein n=1 Tax=Neoarthrinium moseri TaxID=1658444 RepID=A0A9Q0ALS0_9PEZI|nr:hypothetical protein JX266_000125 [Neoarthrinium moseri]KAI1869507.1 hypothetical protein JX265_006597 [Neoarthrinium moseri]